jgi:hypothetical protein
LFDTVLFDAVLFDAVLFDAVLFDAVLFDAVLFDAVLFDAVPGASELVELHGVGALARRPAHHDGDGVAVLGELLANEERPREAQGLFEGVRRDLDPRHHAPLERELVRDLGAWGDRDDDRPGAVLAQEARGATISRERHDGLQRERVAERGGGARRR